MRLATFAAVWIATWAACWFGLSRAWPSWWWLVDCDGTLQETFVVGAYDLAELRLRAADRCWRVTKRTGAREWAPLIATAVAFLVNWIVA